MHTLQCTPFATRSPPLVLLLANVSSNESSIIERCFHFGVGAVLCALLLVLALRSNGENRIPRLGFAACGLTFTLFACVELIALSFGQNVRSPTVVLAGDVAFCAAAAWPLTILGLWAQGTFSSTWRRRLGRVVVVAAGLSAVLLSFSHVTGLLPALTFFAAGKNPPGVLGTAGNALFFLCLGALVLLPGRLRDLLSWISVVALLAGISLMTIRAFEEHFPAPLSWLHPLVVFTRPFNILLIVAGGLFSFSNFRFSDIFAQKGLRILLGALIALASSFLARAIFGSPFDKNIPSRELAVLGFALLVWIAIICYAKITMLSDWLVDRQIFRQADYQRALKAFRETIATQREPAAIFDTGTILVKRTLRIAEVTVCSIEPCEINPMTLIRPESTRECIFPIQKGEEPAVLCLAILPGPGRLTLFNAEIEFLRAVCLAIGRRLEAIDLEKENIERARREAELVKQLLEAELRALRAQINPHFLFNSLNSVAALIAADPRAAEEMTIRLAKIFRHVLIYHDRPFSSLHEEISFLENYLEIEKVRFGERLQVHFDVQEAVYQFPVPTLILQPLVENSIKHGLGAKVGENRLSIRARKHSGYLELTVEDNGSGTSAPRKPSERNSTGLGHRNIEERLQTVYHGNARFFFESEPRIGTRAQILIPVTGLA
jgi:two-component system LytT family sensor kinase